MDCSNYISSIISRAHASRARGQIMMSSLHGGGSGEVIISNNDSPLLTTAFGIRTRFAHTPFAYTAIEIQGVWWHDSCCRLRLHGTDSPFIYQLKPIFSINYSLCNSMFVSYKEIPSLREMQPLNHVTLLRIRTLLRQLPLTTRANKI